MSFPEQIIISRGRWFNKSSLTTFSLVSNFCLNFFFQVPESLFPFFPLFGGEFRWLVFFQFFVFFDLLFMLLGGNIKRQFFSRRGITHRYCRVNVIQEVIGIGCESPETSINGKNNSRWKLLAQLIHQMIIVNGPAVKIIIRGVGDCPFMATYGMAGKINPLKKPFIPRTEMMKPPRDAGERFTAMPHGKGKIGEIDILDDMDTSDLFVFKVAPTLRCDRKNILDEEVYPFLIHGFHSMQSSLITLQL